MKNPFLFDSIQSPLLQEDMPRVRTALARALENTPPSIQESIDGLLESNGKMLRPAFAVLSARFGEFDPEKAYTLAASVEMLHMATLIHDDVIDESAYRRGKPSVQAVFGKRHAVLLGDYLFGRCFLSASQFVTPGQERDILRVVSRICESEIEQGQSLFLIDLSVRRYLRRIAGKTAALFAISCHAGGTACNCPVDTAAILRRIGYCVGMGFQIIDDILDFTSEREILGKPVGGDLKSGIYTLPLIMAFRNGTERRASEKNSPAENYPATGGSHRQSAALPKLVKKYPYSKRTLKKIIREVEERGGIRRARETAGAYTDRALREADRLPDIPAKGELTDLIGRLLHRTY